MLYRGGGGSHQVKFTVANFGVGNFAGPPTRVHSVYCWCARNSRRTLNFAWGIPRSI